MGRSYSFLRNHPAQLLDLLPLKADTKEDILEIDEKIKEGIHRYYLEKKNEAGN